MAGSCGGSPRRGSVPRSGPRGYDVSSWPTLPRRPRASVSVIRCLAAALVPWPARQLMTQSGSGACIAARISLGCPLSPLIGALFRNAPDVAAARLRYSIIRFIDDILILAPTR